MEFQDDGELSGDAGLYKAKMAQSGACAWRGNGYSQGQPSSRLLKKSLAMNRSQCSEGQVVAVFIYCFVNVGHFCNL